MKLLLATNNPAKVVEVQKIMEDAKIFSLADLGLFYEPAETGDTFEENAIQKAAQTQNFLNERGHKDYTVLADDSGLVIPALGGLPGVDSANYMGRETPYPIRNAHIISLLEGEINREAHFVCVIACAFPSGEVVTSRAEIHGQISHQIKGEGGFGYDPIFFLPEYNKTSAELKLDEKNKISHRGLALKKMMDKYL